MKTMTCSQMGGSCDASMTAATAEEMATMGMAHLHEAHPEHAAEVAASTQEEKDAWMADFQAKWDAAPEDAADEAPVADATEEEPAA